jgi:hypothetical protein
MAMAANTNKAASEAKNILKKLFINESVLYKIQRYLTPGQDAIYE